MVVDGEISSDYLGPFEHSMNRLNLVLQRCENLRDDVTTLMNEAVQSVPPEDREQFALVVRNFNSQVESNFSSPNRLIQADLVDAGSVIASLKEKLGE